MSQSGVSRRKARPAAQGAVSKTTLELKKNIMALHLRRFASVVVSGTEEGVNVNL